MIDGAPAEAVPGHVALLEKLYRGELVSKAASDEMMSVLKRQRDHDGVEGT